jgi:hypothetical protein
MTRILITGASFGISVAIAADKNGHNIFDKRGAIPFEQTGMPPLS